MTIVIRDQSGRELRPLCAYAAPRECIHAYSQDVAHIPAHTREPENAPKAAPNKDYAHATEHAYPTHKAIAGHAYSTQLDAALMREAWLLHYADTETRLVYFAPPVTQTDALDWYPEAIAAKALEPTVNEALTQGDNR